MPRQRAAAREILDAPAPRSPSFVLALVLAEQLDLARPIVVEVDLTADQPSRGFLSGLDGSAPIMWRLAGRWPTGRLRLLGNDAGPSPPRTDSSYPMIGMHGWAGAVAVHRAWLIVPSGRVLAWARWTVQADGRTQLQRDCEPTMYDDVEADYQAAVRAMIWFREGLSSRGRQSGDGALWPGGDDDFLDDLWTTLETLTRESGTPYGHDPTSKLFRTRMREGPSDSPLRRMLRRVGLRPSDLKSGRVTRANFRQFATS